jgi:PAS domain S-box-containing protein
MTDRFQHLFDSIVEQVVVVDQDLRITYANPAWMRRVGLTLSQVLGQPCHQVLLTVSAPCGVEDPAPQQVLQTSQPVRKVCWGCARHKQAVEVVASPVFDSAGAVRQVIQVIHSVEPSQDTAGYLAPSPGATYAGHSDIDIADSLREVAFLTSSGRGLLPVLDAILEQLGRVVDYDSASIHLLQKEGWQVIAGRGFPSGLDPVGLILPPDDKKQDWMRRNRQPLVIGDVQADPQWLPIPGTEYIRAWIGAPLLARGEMIGGLNLDKAKPGYYQPEDAELVMAFANQAAVVIENTRLLEAERQRSAQLSLISELSQKVLSILDPDSLLDFAVQAIQRQFGYYYVDIFLTDPSGEYVVFQTSSHREYIPILRERGLAFRIGQKGLTGHVACTGQPCVANDVRKEPRYIADSLLAETRSELVVPIKAGERVLGVLDFNSERLNAFDENDLFVAQSLASQLALGLENARLFEETRKQVARLEGKTRDLELVHELSKVLSSSLDLTHVLETAAEQMAAVFGADHSGIVLFDEEYSRGRVVAECPPTGAIEETLPVRGYLAAEHIIAGRQPLMIEDVQNDPLMAAVREPMKRLNIQSMLIAPLVVKGKTIGSIGLDAIGKQRRFDDEEVALAQTIANQVAYALENARLYQETQQRLRELSLLFEGSALISTSLDAGRVSQATAELTTRALGAAVCAIYSWDREQDVLVNLVDYSPSLDWWKPEEVGTIYELAEYPSSRGVLTSRRPLTIQASDPEADAAEVAWMKELGILSTLFIPMIVRDKVTGLLELMESTREREFTETEINLCQTLANQAAAALENARLFEETEARVRELTAVAIVGQAMTTLELDDVLDSIAENALRAAQAEISSVYLLDKDRKQLIPRSVRGTHSEELEKGTFDLGDGTIGRVALSGQPLIVHDVEADEIFVPKSDAARVIRNTLTVPLAVRNQVIGTLEVCNKIGATGFTATDQRLLSAFAAQAAIAIDNARLYQEVSHHLEEVLILNKVAGAATSTLDFDTAIHRSIVALLEMPHFERAHVLLVNQAAGELVLHPASVSGGSLRADLRIALGQGITGRVAQTGTPVRVDDVRKEPGYIGGYEDTLSEMCVPLRVGDRIIGVLDVQSTRLNAFSENDQRLLTTFASQLSTIIDNARLFNETQQRVRELTALTQVSQALNEAQDLHTILNIVLDETLSLLGCQEGSIVLIDPPGSNKLRIVAERGLGPEVVETFNSRPVYAHEGTYKRALRTGQIVEVPDTSSDPDFLHDVGSHAREVTNIPLVAERGAIGLIAADRLPRDDTTRRLVSTLASMAAVAIDKERLHQETADRLAEVSTLYTLATQITSSLSLSSVLESIVTILKLTLDCRACCIFLIDSTGDYLKLEAGTGLSPTWKELARLRVGEGVSGRVISERRSIYVPDTQLEPDFIFFDRNIRSLLVVPLIIRDKAIGTLSIDDINPNAFDNELRLLTIAAAQAAVAIENAQLYESLRKSYSELEQTYNELRELDKMKSEFVQNISHELRTPLTFIKGYVELLVDGDMGELTEDQVLATNIIAAKADTLSRLVDDIISLQQAGREQLRFEHFSLAELGHAAVQAAQASATEVGISLHDEIPSDLVAPVSGDRRRLTQVFDNLLGNAIKFSDPGDTVTVRVYDQGPVIRAEVEDTGIGIPPDRLPRIFDRFYQVDGTTTRRFGGTGLGLTIVKQIVEAHNGEVGATSEVGKGSLLYFTLPRATDH